jgi:hypothetical protein
MIITSGVIPTVNNTPMWGIAPQYFGNMDFDHNGDYWGYITVASSDNIGRPSELYYTAHFTWPGEYSNPVSEGKVTITPRVTWSGRQTDIYDALYDEVICVNTAELDSNNTACGSNVGSVKIDWNYITANLNPPNGRSLPIEIGFVVQGADSCTGNLSVSGY